MNEQNMAPAVQSLPTAIKVSLALSIFSTLVSVFVLIIAFVGVNSISEFDENSGDYGQVGTITGDNDAPASEQPEEGGGGGYQALPDEPAYEQERTVPLKTTPFMDVSNLSSYMEWTVDGAVYVNRDLSFSIEVPATWVLGAFLTDGSIACSNSQDFLQCITIRAVWDNDILQGATTGTSVERSIDVYVVATERKSSPAVTDLPAVFIEDRNGRSFYMTASGDEYGKPGMDTPEYKTLFDEGNAIRESFQLINI